MIDTHCHLYDEAFDNDRQQAIDRAVQSGIKRILLPAIDSQSVAALLSLYHSNTALFSPMAGLHPTFVKQDYEDELAIVEQQLFHSVDRENYVAVGEIGMDLYWDRTFEGQQREVLRRQMLWSFELNLPIALHIRKAHNEVFALFKELNHATYRGVMHCFGGSVQEAHRAIEMGFMLGIGGVVTFKNATMADVVREVPLSKILLETDAPYLSPVPHRGKRNESAYIPLIASMIADIKGVSVEEVAKQTTINAISLFSLQ